MKQSKVRESRRWRVALSVVISGVCVIGAWACGEPATGGDGAGAASLPNGGVMQPSIPNGTSADGLMGAPMAMPGSPATPSGAGDMSMNLPDTGDMPGGSGTGASAMEPPDVGNAGMGGTGGNAGTGAGGTAGDGAVPNAEGGCTPAPPGSFSTMIVTGTGPGGNYTIARPSKLGEGGFLHPPVAWGNGLGTTPSLYTALLENLASNGFVVIANPGTGSDPQVVRQGLEWLIDQNASGEYAGKLAADCAGTIGYSMGGGAAVGSGAHPAVKAIVSMHGLQDAAEMASGPILLTTSEGDTFVTKSGFVEPCYGRSSVQPTILASHSAGDHLDPLGTGGEDAAPAVAWLRYWIYGDQAQRDWFFGDDCKLCSWPDFRRKNHPEWD